MSGSKTINNDVIDLEGGEEKNRSKVFRGQKAVKIHNQALLSGLAYCLSSCSMILVNKFVLSSYDFNAGISLMLYQVNIISEMVSNPVTFFIYYNWASFFSSITCLMDVKLFKIFLLMDSFDNCLSAEFCVCGNRFHFENGRYYFNRATHMEIGSCLVPCECDICRNAYYQHFQVGCSPIPGIPFHFHEKFIDAQFRYFGSHGVGFGTK